ncbi:hypothetical protein [Mongoliitalea lutea]|uniref:Uncharacterized protein n=1 Tax=Mongoliitalea lutea TaxID=849756 RepID=A0A8J3CX93_9BACT|nr:hypothetical protein [Mongoliitalea lutea]GHB32610.1 hypothetical protein GCM10008106_11800 [Mongoliitalea lutea]
MIAGCNQVENIEPTVELDNRAIGEVKSIDEGHLIELSAFFASILNKPEVLNEFYGYSKLEGNEGELEFSLRKVFETEFDQIARKSSAIVSYFKENGGNLRTQSTSFDLDFFIKFMKENDLEVLAPYLARNFSLEELDELTISWWTKEMEEEGLKKDPNWKGETPAFKIRLSEDLSFESIMKGLEDKTLEVFMVSDEYAMKNPTIVFGAFEEGLYDRELQLKEARVSEANLSYINVVPSNVGIGCAQIQSNDVVRYNIPDLRIRDNTRGWPNGNYITIWVAYAAYSSNSSGLPTLGFSVNRLVTEKKINRSDFDWKSNFVGQPLLTHWHESNLSIQIIFAYKKSGKDLTQTVNSVSNNPNTGATVTSTQTLTRRDTRTFGSQHWWRCPEINGAHKVDTGHGFRGTNAIWQMQGQDGRIQFTLEPRLTRL